MRTEALISRRATAIRRRSRSTSAQRREGGPFREEGCGEGSCRHGSGGCSPEAVRGNSAVGRRVPGYCGAASSGRRATGRRHLASERIAVVQACYQGKVAARNVRVDIKVRLRPDIDRVACTHAAATDRQLHLGFRDEPLHATEPNNSSCLGPPSTQTILARWLAAADVLGVVPRSHLVDALSATRCFREHAFDPRRLDQPSIDPVSTGAQQRRVPQTGEFGAQVAGWEQLMAWYPGRRPAALKKSPL